MVEFVFLEAREGTKGATVGVWRAAEDVERSPWCWVKGLKPTWMGEKRAGSGRLLGR